MTTNTEQLTGEKADILETLGKHRGFLRYTARDLTDEQAAARTTVSELCVGGLIKHVAAMEEGWVDFVLGKNEGVSGTTEAEWAAQHRMLPGETLAGLLDHYEKVATRTEDVVAGLPDLDEPHPLPEAPWFPPGAAWTSRRVLLHIIAETAQHAGHADIIRESFDGSKTMG